MSVADILKTVAALEWIALGVLVLWKLNYWNSVMQRLYDTLKKDMEELDG